jgi:predicted secreted Zn-dependent protease
MGIVAIPPALAHELQPRQDLSVQASVRYYDVSGDSTGEVRQQMMQLGPMDHGQHVDAYTDWQIRWRYSYSTGPGGACTLDSTQVIVTVVTTLPRWSPRQSSAPQLRSIWAQFSASLALHENGHKAIALAAAEEIRDLLNALPSQSSCKALDTLANSTGQGILDEARANDAAYDERTHHGATQGAVIGHLLPTVPRAREPNPADSDRRQAPHCERVQAPPGPADPAPSGAGFSQRTADADCGKVLISRRNHGYALELGDNHCPEVRASSDAKEARWVPIGELRSLERELFEDHACILDHFLHTFE